MWQVLLGLAAGTLGCCVNIPFDVAKSRIQARTVMMMMIIMIIMIMIIT